MLSCVFIFTVKLHLPIYNFEKLEHNLLVKGKKIWGGITQFWYKCDHWQHKLMTKKLILMRNGNEMVKI